MTAIPLRYIKLKHFFIQKLLKHFKEWILFMPIKTLQDLVWKENLNMINFLTSRSKIHKLLTFNSNKCETRRILFFRLLVCVNVFRHLCESEAYILLLSGGCYTAIKRCYINDNYYTNFIIKTLLIIRNWFS